VEEGETAVSGVHTASNLKMEPECSSETTVSICVLVYTALQPRRPKSGIFTAVKTSSFVSNEITARQMKNSNG
jgi:hypothetical protein